MHDAAGTVSAILAEPRAQQVDVQDEGGLIRAAQRGDQDAFERLVRTYDRNVLRLAINTHSGRQTRLATSIRRRF